VPSFVSKTRLSSDERGWPGWSAATAEQERWVGVWTSQDQSLAQGWWDQRRTGPDVTSR
jgi:hypothetical protein